MDVTAEPGGGHDHVTHFELQISELWSIGCALAVGQQFTLQLGALSKFGSHSTQYSVVHFAFP